MDFGKTAGTQTDVDGAYAEVGVHFRPTAGSWEPLEDQASPVGLRVRLKSGYSCGTTTIPAGERGKVLQLHLTHCDVDFDNFTSGSLVFPMSLFDAWIPGSVADDGGELQSCISRSTQTLLEQQAVETQTLDAAEQGGSATMPASCERRTEYTKLLLDCDAACARIGEALGNAISGMPDRTYKEIRRSMIGTYDIWINVREQLHRYRYQVHCDSSAQTGVAAGLRLSIPAQ